MKLPASTKWVSIILSCLSAIFFSSNTSFCQQRTVNISGKIVEEITGEVLIGANVILYTDSMRISESVRGAATNKYGFYSIPDVLPGTYFIFASSIGYETSMNKYVLNVSQNSVEINFELKKKAILIDEVVVSDNRAMDFSRAPGTIEVNPDLVQKLPSLGGESDLFRALQLLPGVTAPTEISSGIYVRGSSADQNLTLIDGVLVYNPSHLGGFSGIFNSDAIRNIKLLKGAFPAEYGGRISSVLDVTLREGSREKFIGNLGVSTISSRLTLEGPIDTNATVILSARTMYLDKILPMFKRLDNLPRYGFTDMNGKLSYELSDKDRIYISGFFSEDNVDSPPEDRDVGFGIKWSNATLNLTWTSVSSPKLFNNTSLMYTNYNFNTLLKDKAALNNPQDFYTSSSINDISLRKELYYFPSEHHTLKLGADIIMHMFNTTTSNLYVRELDYIPDYGTKINAMEASIYAQDELTITDGLDANIGGRFYFYQYGKFLAFEPRISATYYLFDRLVLRGAFAIAHQTLHLVSRNDIYLPTDVWFPSTATVKPSKSIQGSFGFEATSVDKTFLLSVEGYYKDLQNLYEYKEVSDFTFGTSFEQNLTRGRGEAYGVEIFLNKRIGKFTGWIGYTLAWTKRYFEDLNRGLPFYPRYDRRHDISFVASVDIIKDLNINFTWVYGTGQAYFLPNGQYAFTGLNQANQNSNSVFIDYSAKDAYRLPPFHKLDLSIQYTTGFFGNELELSIDIYNVYNRNNIFSKYIGYKTEENGKRTPVLKQFTLFPFLPTFGINYRF